MADFYPAAQTIQYPDILGSYLRGVQAPQQLQAQQQENTLRGLNIDQMRLALRGQQALVDFRQAALAGLPPGANDVGNPSAPQNNPQATLGGASGGIQNGPQGAVSFRPAAPAPASSYDGTQPASAGLSIPDIHAPILTDPRIARIASVMDPNGIGKSLIEGDEAAMKRAQFQAQGPIDLIDSIFRNPNPAKIVDVNPGLKQRWNQIAPQLGMDPTYDFNDDNVRRALAFAGNQIRGTVGQTAHDYPVPDQIVRGRAGEVYSVDPFTHKPTQVTGENLKQVQGPNGPVYLPSDQAAGQQPFNATIFGASQLSDQALQFAADTYRNTGKMPAAFGRSPAMQARVLDRVAADASATGDTTTAIAARTAARNANGQALTQNTKLEAATTSYYNTLDKNLTNLQELAGKVDSTGSPLVNKVFRAWQQGVAGDPDVAKYVTYLNSAASEFAKIQSGSLGNAPVSDAARKHADDVINKFMSQGQINAVAEAMRGEGNNRLSSIREERQSLMGSLGQGAPGTATAPQPSAAGGAQAPRVNAQGWVLHADKNGNKAYVSPDGKQFQPVQ